MNYNNANYHSSTRVLPVFPRRQLELELDFGPLRHCKRAIVFLRACFRQNRAETCALCLAASPCLGARTGTALTAHKLRLVSALLWCAKLPAARSVARPEPVRRWGCAATARW